MKHSLLMLLAVSLLAPYLVYAEATTTEAAQRDAKRITDLAQIKEALDKYAAYYWFVPSYPPESPAMSDGFWKATVHSRDFKKRIKPFLNQLPIDPLNEGASGFHYVYESLPVQKGRGCAGKTVLFARLETDIYAYEQCRLDDTRSHALFIIAPKLQSKSASSVAAVFAPFFGIFFVGNR